MTLTPYLCALLLGATCLAACADGTPAQNTPPADQTTRLPEPTTFAPTQTSEIPETRTTGNGHTGGIVRVAGARLDGKPETGQWPNFTLYQDRPTDELCKAFHLIDPVSVPTQVVDVSLGPAPGFTVTRTSEDKACNSYRVPDCRGFTFPPAAPEASCGVSVRASSPGRTRIALTLQARCHAADRTPCDDPRVAAADKPVTVTWTWNFPQDLIATAHPCREEEWRDHGNQCPAPTTTTTTPTTTSTTTTARRTS